MRIVCLADTHGQHENLLVPEGDVLIHAGDCTDGGTRQESIQFLNWFSAQPHELKIIVPGNHDFYFEKTEIEEILPSNINLLIDSGLEHQGLNFWGSPYSPVTPNWAFSRERGKDIAEHWNLIPENVDFLITHTPPYKILDEIGSGEKLGCEELARAIEEKNPGHHLFGHIHFAAGTTVKNGIPYFNTTILDERMRIMHSPAVIQI